MKKKGSVDYVAKKKFLSRGREKGKKKKSSNKEILRAAASCSNRSK